MMVHDEPPSDHAPFLTPCGEVAYKRAEAMLSERAGPTDLLALLLDEIDQSHAVITQRDADLVTADRDLALLNKRINEHIESHICEFNGPAYETYGSLL